MARQTFRLNLLASEFPLLMDLYGRSIVYPQQDMHYQRPNAFTGTEADKNLGIPQLVFCENVMPTSYGLQSITYNLTVNRTISTDFDEAWYLRDAAENRTLFSPGISGGTTQRYTYNVAGQQWQASAVAGLPANCRCTVATVKNRTFVHFSFFSSYEWTGVWNAVAYSGIVQSSIKGIVTANAYLVLYDRNTIYWSSTLDPTDFVPSLVTGAGSQRVLSIKGDIVVCRPIDDGFIIYTTGNTVIAKYSGNTRFPWNFKELKNSSGIKDQEHAALLGSGNDYFTYTTDGLMRNTFNRSEPEFPVVNEFLGSRRIEKWDSVNKVVLTQDSGDPLNVKLDYIGNRWLVISYGIGQLDFALIFDSALKRWGKLRITHVDCFEFYGNSGSAGTIQADTWAQLAGTWAQQNNSWFDYGGLIIGGAASLATPYKQLAFLQNDGGVKIVNFDVAADNDDAVAIIGRIQFLRDKLFTLTEIDAEGIGAEPQTKLQIWCSMDGLNIHRKLYPVKQKSLNKLQKWVCLEVAMNHTLCFMGNFRFNTIITRGLIAGKR